MTRAIAIVGGTGAEGFGLAARFARAGARVIIGSRDLARAQAAAARIPGVDPGVEGMLNADAVAAADIVVLTVPLAAQAATLDSVRSSFRRGAILVDATVAFEPLAAGSAGQQAALHVPGGVRVVGAFHSVSARLLAQLDQPVDSDVLLCGDDPDAKSAVAELVAMLRGARAIDAGPLSNARLVEGLTPLLIAINKRYKVKHAGVRITGLPAKAD